MAHRIAWILGGARPRIDPRVTPNRSEFEPSFAPCRPELEPRFTRASPQTDVKSAPGRPQVDPRLSPDRLRIAPKPKSTNAFGDRMGSRESMGSGNPRARWLRFKFAKPSCIACAQKLAGGKGVGGEPHDDARQGSQKGGRISEKALRSKLCCAPPSRSSVHASLSASSRAKGRDRHKDELWFVLGCRPLRVRWRLRRTSAQGFAASGLWAPIASLPGGGFQRRGSPLAKSRSAARFSLALSRRAQRRSVARAAADPDRARDPRAWPAPTPCPGSAPGPRPAPSGSPREHARPPAARGTIDRMRRCRVSSAVLRGQT